MRDFCDFITDLDDGELARRLAEEAAQVVRAARSSGLVGTLTLTLNFKPDGRTLIVVPKVTTKIPTAKSNSTVFFDTEDGVLSKNDPLKQTPHLRGVRGGATS